jgi:hypothetical protein
MRYIWGLIMLLLLWSILQVEKRQLTEIKAIAGAMLAIATALREHETVFE